MLSQLDPTEIVELARTEDTGGFFNLPIPPVDANKLLLLWSGAVDRGGNERRLQYAYSA